MSTDDFLELLVLVALTAVVWLPLLLVMLLTIAHRRRNHKGYSKWLDAVFVIVLLPVLTISTFSLLLGVDVRPFHLICFAVAGLLIFGWHRLTAKP